MLLLLALNIPLLLLFDNSESLLAFQYLYLYLVSMVVLYSDLLSLKNIMNSIGLLLILALCILFYIAHWAEKRSNSKWTTNPYIYSFSLAVYCTAWTYYGSIGVAAESGLSYLLFM
jgi:hypothetical protein